MTKLVTGKKITVQSGHPPGNQTEGSGSLHWGSKTHEETRDRSLRVRGEHMKEGGYRFRSVKRFLVPRKGTLYRKSLVLGRNPAPPPFHVQCHGDGRRRKYTV